MSSRQLTIGEAFDSFRQELNLSWVAGRDARARLLTRNLAPGKRPRLLGPLNFNSPNRIQLLGAAEVRLIGEQSAIDISRFEYSLSSTCDMMVISNGLEPPQSLIDLAEQEQIALMVSTLDYSPLQSKMRFLFLH